MGGGASFKSLKSFPSQFRQERENQRVPANHLVISLLLIACCFMLEASANTS